MSKEPDPFEPQGPQSRYDDALLCANWNPVIELLPARGTAGRPKNHRRDAHAVSDEEANAFIHRIYAFGA